MAATRQGSQFRPQAAAGRDRREAPAGSSPVSAVKPVVTGTGGPGVDDPLLNDLDRLLDELKKQYETLREVGLERREAIRRANPDGVAACIGRENDAVQAIAEVEKRRITVVGLLAQRFAIPERSQARLTAIAAALGGVAGERLARRAQELRELLELVRKENEVVRLAADQLARHMEGLWKQACGVLSHARTYGRQGSVEAGPSIVSALDLRS